MRIRPVLLLALPLVMTIGACKREPDFDERYRAASAKVTQTAEEIDAQITGAPQAEATGTAP